MLQYLFSPTKQFTYESGKLLDGGKIYVYIKDTTNLATLYDVDGDYTNNPILLDANGRASVKADDEYEYRLEIYTNRDVLLYTCNAFCDGGTGDGGLSVVRHDETLSGNGTSQSLLGVINIPLAVDETMTAYTATVEEKESLVLGVNGDWFNDTFGSALNTRVDWDTFSACCSGVKGGLANKLDASAYDLSNYYNKQEITYMNNNFVTNSAFNDLTTFINEYKQDRLTFEYDENSAISSINNSAIAGGSGNGDFTPWISGAKIIADTQLMTDNMLIQVLSSFDLSGNKNHCIAVKGGMYRFPNQWELASSVQNTNWFMEKSAMSAYVPNSSFSSYTTYAEGRMDSIFQLANSAYTTAVNNYYNKLDISAFSAWSADQGETYTLVGGNNISVSSDDDEKTTTISVTGEVGDTTPWISGAKILDETKYLMPGDFFQALSSFTLSGNKNHCIAVKGGGFYMPNNYMLASCINETQYFVTNSAFSAKLDDYLPTASFTGYTATVNPYFNQLFSSAAWLINNKLDISSFSSFSANLSGDYLEKSESANFYPMTGNPSGFLTAHQDLSYISGKIDDKLDKSESGNYYPMTGNPSGFLTAHQSLDGYATTGDLFNTSSVLSGAIDYVSANAGGSANANLLYVYSHNNNGEMTYTVPTYSEIEDYVINKAPFMLAISGQKETEYGSVAVNSILNYVGEIGYDENTTGYRFFGMDYVGFNDQNENNLTREIRGFQIDFYTDGNTTGYGISSNVYVNDKLTTASHLINPGTLSSIPVVTQIFDTDISARIAGSASVAGYASNVASANLWNAAYNIIQTYSGQWLLANP